MWSKFKINFERIGFSMSVEYYYVNEKSQEFVELGKLTNSEEMLNTIKQYKSRESSYEEFWKEVKEYNFIKELEEDKEFTYLFWFKESFLKEVYNWVTEEVEFLTDYSFSRIINDKFKFIASRYIPEEDINNFIKINKNSYSEYESYMKDLYSDKTRLREILYQIKTVCSELDLNSLKQTDKNKFQEIIVEDGLLDKALLLIEDI